MFQTAVVVLDERTGDDHTRNKIGFEKVDENRYSLICGGRKLKTLDFMSGGSAAQEVSTARCRISHFTDPARPSRMCQVVELDLVFGPLITNATSPPVAVDGEAKDRTYQDLLKMIAESPPILLEDTRSD